MQNTDDILGVSRLPNETTKKIMQNKLATDTGPVSYTHLTLPTSVTV